MCGIIPIFVENKKYMTKKDFLYFDVVNLEDPRAVIIQEKVKELIKQTSGVEDIREVEDLDTLFDEVEKLGIIEQTNFLHLMISKYYVLHLVDEDAFLKKIEKQISRSSFKRARDITYLGCDDKNKEERASFDAEIDVVQSYFEG